MARPPMIAGNWKCNMRLDTAFQLAGEIVSLANDVEGVEKVVCPPFIYLATVETALTMSTVRLGAQDVHWEDDAAATGEIGPGQLEELCDYVLIGSGTSDRQMKSLAEELADLGQACDNPMFRSSADNALTWIVIDFVDLVAHLFEPNQRAYYDLEGLWSDAQLVEWQQEKNGTEASKP